MKDRCPLCGCKWKAAALDSVTYSPCVGECGMWYLIEQRKYKRYVGKYVVYWNLNKGYVLSWNLNKGGEDIVHVWDNKPNSLQLLYVGPTLPYDITEDMIKLYLTFQ